MYSTSRISLSPIVPIGSRLKEERERLGLNQTAFGDAAGVGRKTQFNYESEERSPDANYLAAVAEMGVDVRYVITGSRDYEPPPELKPEEQMLLERYRHASREVRNAALGALLGARASEGGVSQVFHGKVGHNISGGDNRGMTIHHSPPPPKKARGAG